jgi:hypothetical protein
MFPLHKIQPEKQGNWCLIAVNRANVISKKIHSAGEKDILSRPVHVKGDSQKDI